MEVDEWCKHLLEKFFPNTSGIWADHTHTYHVYIFKIVKFCFECGLIDMGDIDQILNFLYMACIALLKLEEAWREKLRDSNKLSETFKAYNLTTHFRKCREEIASILI